MGEISANVLRSPLLIGLGSVCTDQQQAKRPDNRPTHISPLVRCLSSGMSLFYRDVHDLFKSPGHPFLANVPLRLRPGGTALGIMTHGERVQRFASLGKRKYNEAVRASRSLFGSGQRLCLYPTCNTSKPACHVHRRVVVSMSCDPGGPDVASFVDWEFCSEESHYAV